MDWSNLGWPAAVLVISIVAIILFREQLEKKIVQLKKLWWPGGGAEFSDEIAILKPKVEKVGADIRLPNKSHRTKTISQSELFSLAPRDIVLVSWGRMRQQLIDSVSAKGVAPDNTGSLANILINLVPLC